MEFTLKFIKETLIPALRKDAKDIADLEAKYFAAIGDNPSIVDDQGQPVECKFSDMAPTDMTDGEPAVNADPMAGKSSDETTVKLVNEAVEKAVSSALKKFEGERDRSKAVAAAAGGSLARQKWTIPAEVSRYGRLKSFKDTDKHRHEFNAEERAYRFGAWCLAVLGNQKYAKLCDSIGVKLHQESVNTTGGYLVPPEFSADIIDLREQYGVFRRNAKIEPMKGDTKSVPRRTGGLTAYFAGEGSAGTESTKRWDQVNLTAKKIMCITRLTSELNEDAIINVGDDLASEIAYAFSLLEDQCGFIGDGTSTYGGIVGARNKLVNVWGVSATTAGIYKQASGSTWGALTMNDLNGVMSLIPQYALARGNAKWFCSTTFFYQVMQALMAAAGGNTIMDIVNGVPRPMFLGFPVEFSQVFPVATASAVVPVIFGDLELAATFGDRRGETVALSDSATIGGESVFERDEIAMRGTARFDVVVHDVGSGSAGGAGPIVGLTTG